MLEILIIAVALAMDAFAVSVTSGATIRRMRLRHAMLIAAFFGVFQAVMPLIGWLTAYWAHDIIEPWDHWVAFVLLAGIGGKMFWEAGQKDEDEDEPYTNPLNVWVLFTLAIATSIDALAAGVTFSFLAMPIAWSVTIIGVVTFVLSLLGTWIGKRFGHFFEHKLEMLGGLILIGIGLKILIEHTLFS